MLLLNQLSFTHFILLVSISIPDQFVSSLLIPSSIRNGGIYYRSHHDESVARKKHRNLLRHSLSTSVVLDMSSEQSNGREKEKILEIIENQTLLPVETCINLHQKCQKDEQNEKNKVIFIDCSWWHKGNLNGRKM